jgi:MerR family redox-sensitive transcriptional activator SoxR
MASIKIGELAKHSGISTSAIRFYESVGLLPAPVRESGWRRYDGSDLERLHVIQAARAVGFSIAEIRLLLDGFPKKTNPSTRWKKLAKQKLPEIDQIIQRTLALKFLIEAGMDCNCEDVALCINSKGLACHPVTGKQAIIKMDDIKPFDRVVS